GLGGGRGMGTGPRDRLRAGAGAHPGRLALRVDDPRGAARGALAAHRDGILLLSRDPDPRGRVRLRAPQGAGPPPRLGPSGLRRRVRRLVPLGGGRRQDVPRLRSDAHARAVRVVPDRGGSPDPGARRDRTLDRLVRTGMRPMGWRLISNPGEDLWRVVPMVLALATLGTIVGAVWLQSLASIRGYHLFRAGSPYHVPAMILLPILFI